MTAADRATTRYLLRLFTGVTARCSAKEKAARLKSANDLADMLIEDGLCVVRAPVAKKKKDKV